MDADRWQRIQSLFHEAAEMPPDARRAFLTEACGPDLQLLDAVQKMLDADAGVSLLDGDVAHLADAMLNPGAAATMPDVAFGPYRLVRLLGEGGMGVVYLGRRDDLGSVAAIKILRDAWLSPARRDRFAAEQRILAALDHPSIARLFDADTLPDGTPWFVMEFVDGVTITEYCRASSSTVLERLRLFRAVCDAVQHAHRHLVVHRDLKPSNILVTSEGRVKLLDFGISKQLETLDSGVDRTRTIFRMMTPAYAAPEQLRGEPVGLHTDVYALGVVLYELLAGRPPFDLANRTPTEAEAIVTASDVTPPGAGADLDVLCLTAMHKEPSRRYATVEALARDVGHFINGEPLEARGDSFGYRAGKFLRRRWRPLTAAAAMLAVVVGLASFYTIRLSVARTAALQEAARTQRIQRFTLNLLEGGDDASGPAESLRVITLVDRGLQQARGLDADPLLQAELYGTLGGIYQQLGKFDEADGLLKTALDQRRRLLGPDHPDVADSLLDLGQLREAQASYDDAERLIRESLETGRRRLGPEHPLTARATTALGQVLENRGSYAEAATVLEEAVAVLSRPGHDDADLALALSGLANTRFYLGQLDQSESLNQRVLVIDRRLYGDRHPQVADTIVNLGAIQYERGRYGDAERYQREALEIIRAWHGPQHPRTASALTMVARAIVQQAERYDEAAAMLNESLAIQEGAYGPVHPRVASALNELGIVALRRRQLDEAEKLFQRMVRIYREVYADKHYYIGVGLSNLGGVEQERGAYAKAESLFREALRRYGDTLTPGHQLIGIVRVRLGRALLGQRRHREAEAESLAGYEILTKQTHPPERWVAYAREDLAAAYDALKQPERAAIYRKVIQ